MVGQIYIIKWTAGGVGGGGGGMQSAKAFFTDSTYFDIVLHKL